MCSLDARGLVSRENAKTRKDAKMPRLADEKRLECGGVEKLQSAGVDTLFSPLAPTSSLVVPLRSTL